jgi:D-3-phosphoglycerate dehydrogenase
MCSSTAVDAALSGIKPAIEQAVAEQLRDLVTLSIVDLASPTWSADLAGADYWVVQLGQYDAALIDSSPSLKGIITCSMGFDHIDLAAATRHNVPVVNTPEFAVSVAEAALTLILAITKSYPAMQRAVSRGTWSVQAHERSMTLSGKALGIIGLGNIGVHVARYGRALQMSVLAADPYLTPECAAERGTDELVDLSELLARSDVVLLSCPLSEGD